MLLMRASNHFGAVWQGMKFEKVVTFEPWLKSLRMRHTAL
jgi:hypothetical protein